MPLMLVVAAGVAACVVPNPAYCDDIDRPCATGVCDVPHHTCVEPADAPGGDDGRSVDGPAVIDSAMEADAAPVVPIVETFQRADIVLGQVNFDTAANPGCVGTAADADGVAEANSVLYVHEKTRNRVLMWVPTPATTNAAATGVLGQSSLTNCTATGTVDASHFGSSGSVAAAAGKLVLADGNNNRVLVWSPAPTTNGAAATIVLGQPTMTTSGTGNGASAMSSPKGAWTDGTRLAIADQVNNRILIWTAFPTVNAEAADLVLGQAGFGMTQGPSAPTASNMLVPSGVWSNGTKLFVADTGHQRVLIWNTFPTSNNQPADVVIGQSEFTTEAPGLSATALRQPYDVAANADAVFVADMLNDRVVVFSPIPTENGAAAAFVLGQPDLDTGFNNPAAAQRSLDQPRHIYLTPDRLWVADFNHNRTLSYELYP